MQFKAVVTVMLKKSVLDPQGAAVERALKTMGSQGVGSVRIGKVIEMVVEGRSAAEVEARAAEWADKILANPIMENYSVTVEPLS
ncbi:phosphoribosylformylglycinamidine synthase subunit PurS [Deltaproteobacteria bacterium OttesenSCG-928-M10]|nr:phosphoribosylformylglycinamidine synthase subunit PurS [Deltaproteobacteria bacterium OttesenSCG-928-M10]